MANALNKQKITDFELEHVNELINKYKEENGTVITLIQGVQESFGFLPHHVLYYLSDRLKIPLSEIYGVSTFYSQFTFVPKGKYVITVCDGTACHIQNSVLLLNFLRAELNIENGETSEDKLFSLEVVSCLGCCAIAPVVVINEDVHGNLTTNKLKKIIRKLKRLEKDKGKNG